MFGKQEHKSAFLFRTQHSITFYEQKCRVYRLFYFSHGVQCLWVKFICLQLSISVLRTQIAVTFQTTKFAAPNPRQVKMVVSGVLVLGNPALRTVIAGEKVNAAAYTIHVPDLAAVNVIQILTVV